MLPTYLKPDATDVGVSTSSADADSGVFCLYFSANFSGNLQGNTSSEEPRAADNQTRQQEKQ